MLQTEFSAALNQVCAERGISPEAVLETIKVAMLSAYRKEYGGGVDDLRVEVDAESGETHLFRDGEDITPSGFGRIAAQTAKQVILQKIREEEKASILEEYRKKLGKILSGRVFRIEKDGVIVDLGRAHGILPSVEQIPNENYQVNQRIRVLLKDIREGPKGPQIILSRASSTYIKELFALEVPEISTQSVEIEAIAREPGSRTKIAVSASSDKIDPVGSCVGQKGVRVQAVMAELGDERIDIIPYDEESEKYISNALSPAKVKVVKVNKNNKKALVEVSEDQLSLAIGKGGQNVRLAAKLTGWKIDIKGTDILKKAVSESKLAKYNLSPRVEKALIAAGIESQDKLEELSDKQLKALKGIGDKAVAEISEKLNLSDGKKESN